MRKSLATAMVLMIPSGIWAQFIGSASADHSGVQRLFQSLGLQERMSRDFPQEVQRVVQRLSDTCRECSPRLLDEFARRLTASSLGDDLVRISGEVFESYLTPEEIGYAADRLEAAKQGRFVFALPELDKKIRPLLPKISEEVRVRCHEMVLQRGKEVARQLLRDHPEWVRPSVAPH
jgi:hypothetical protein